LTVLGFIPDPRLRADGFLSARDRGSNRSLGEGGAISSGGGDFEIRSNPVFCADKNHPHKKQGFWLNPG
jgi:hypothetical protein